MSPSRYGPGDVIFFKDGAHARWHVEGRVRKLAFCRKTLPVLLGFALRALSKFKRMLLPSDERAAGNLTASPEVESASGRTVYS
jgi:hypothetical protein